MNTEKIQARAELYVKLNELKNTDYKLLKYMDGELTAEEYEPFKQQRAQLRVRIRELESEINTLREQLKQE